MGEWVREGGSREQGGNPGIRLARIDVDMGIEERPRINPTANSPALMMERIKMATRMKELKTAGFNI